MASFVVYVLAANAGNPLADLMGSIDPGTQQKLEYRRELLDLETPAPLRYFKWLGGALGCFVGSCDLGISFSNSEIPVIDLLGGAMWSTLQLVTLASVIAIILGVGIGVITALRQYSGFDYSVTLMAFIFYSLPVFWVAVLLKEFGAIRFNAFLDDPHLDWWAVGLIAVIVGLIAASVTGANKKKKILVFFGAFLATTGIIYLLLATGWFKQPSIGIIGASISAIGIVALIVGLFMGFQNKKIIIASLLMVAVMIGLFTPFLFLFFYMPNPLSIVIVIVALIIVGAIIGYTFGGEDRRSLMRLLGVSGAIYVIPLVLDQMLLKWPSYQAQIPLSKGIISTIGSVTPNIKGDMWMHMLDNMAHIILPTIALLLISFAAYTRYTRSSVLEVMNQDYIRTARAKGLGERDVIVKHALRNALIPIATIIALDFGALIGGAIITERIFAWSGMGAMFNQGLDRVDVNLVMGFFVITGIATVVFNVIADLVYSSLDPRIRVE